MRKIILIISTFMFSIISVFAIQNPVTMLDNTVVATQNKLIKSADMYQKTPYKLLALINKKVVPVVDTAVMAQLVVGTQKWQGATAEQQQQFIKSATQMLTFMYAKNVASAGKYNVELFNFNKDDNSWKTKPLVVVNGKITNINSHQSSDFSVKLFQKNGKWHVYDFNVAGVSILNTYKQQFAPYDNVPEMTKAADKLTNDIKLKYYPNLIPSNPTGTNPSTIAKTQDANA